MLTRSTNTGYLEIMHTRGTNTGCLKIMLKRSTNTGCLEISAVFHDDILRWTMGRKCPPIKTSTDKELPRKSVSVEYKQRFRVSRENLALAHISSEHISVSLYICKSRHACKYWYLDATSHSTVIALSMKITRVEILSIVSTFTAVTHQTVRGCQFPGTLYFRHVFFASLHASLSFMFIYCHANRSMQKKTRLNAVNQCGAL
jgi:hypothetical protein